jgi:hypothetical protein
MRAGGAGIPAFYTPTGVGTPVAEGKPKAVFDGTCGRTTSTPSARHAGRLPTTANGRRSLAEMPAGVRIAR